MPINVEEVERNLTEQISSVPIVKRIIINPLFTAITITIILLVIIMFIFKDAEVDENTSLFKLSVRTSIYAFIFISGLLFLNNYHLKEEIISKTKSGAMEELFGGIDKIGEGTLADKADLVPVTLTIPKYPLVI